MTAHAKLGYEKDRRTAQSPSFVIGGLNRRGLQILFLAVALALITAGCVSNHATPLVVQTAAEGPRTTNQAEYLTLKLLTFNIWGLPSWLTGARPGRYSQIAHELGLLDPDIILLQEAWTAKARKAAPCDGRWSNRARSQPTYLLPAKWTYDPESVPDYWRGFLPFFARGFPRQTGKKRGPSK